MSGVSSAYFADDQKMKARRPVPINTIVASPRQPQAVVERNRPTMDTRDAAFVAEDITTVVSSAIGSVLSNASYTPNKTKDWSNSIIQSSLKGLQSLNRPYKYCLTVTLMQKNGAGLVSAASVYWDPTKDGVCKVSWENETMHCVVVVFGVSVNVDDAPDDCLFEGDAACAKKVDPIAAQAEM